MSKREYDKVEDVLKKYHYLKKVTDPTPEDLLEDAFRMRDQAFSVLDREVSNPCEKKKLDLSYRPRLVMRLEGDTRDLDKMYDSLYSEKIFNKKEGYILLNDYFKDLKLNKDEEKGVSLTFGKGEFYQTYIEQVKEESITQTRETVEISGTKFEIRRGQNEDDIYLRVVGKQVVSNDDSDKALKEALKDESLSTSPESEEKRLKVAAEFNIGNRFSIYESDSNHIVSDVSVGRQFGILGETEGYTRMRGDIRYRYVQRNDEKEEVASIEARIYYDKQYYDSQEKTSPYGVEIKRNYKVGPNSNLYLEGGLHHKENVVEKKELQWEKTISIGFEHRF